MEFLALLEALLEGKIDDVLDKHTTIPHNVKQDYLKQVPANNAQHLDWVLNQHTKGNIKPEHDIHSILGTFNRVKDKLAKKQINQYKSVDELHTAVLPHADGAKQSTNEKSSKGTETLYNSPTMTIKQHHNYESTVSAANLPESNAHKEKAGWCVSVGNGGGASHYDTYTQGGFHPVYTIEHKHPDGSSSRHMLVYDHNKTQDQQELRNEADHRPGFSEYSSTRPDLLDHYGKEHPELLKTPIAKFFTESGRKGYEKDTAPVLEKLNQIKAAIPKTGMTDKEYMANFKAGQEKQQGSIHNVLAKAALSDTQLNHLIEHSSEGSKANIATRQDLSEDHMKKLANTSNMIVHSTLLQRPNLSDTTFNTILNKAHPSINEVILKHPKFGTEHIDTMINKSKTPVDFTSFIERSGNKLETPHIDKLLKGGDVNTTHALIRHSNKNIDDTQLNNLVNKGDDSTYQHLAYNMPDRLDKDHIDTMVKNGSAYTHSLLVSEAPKFLKSEHIDTMIDKRDNNTNTQLINRMTDKLKPHHIYNMITKGGEDIHEELLSRIPDKLDKDHINALVTGTGLNSNKMLLKHASHKLSSDDITTMIDRGHQGLNQALINANPKNLESKHISSLIDNGDEETHKAIIRRIPDKLEPNHINALIDKGTTDNHLLLMNQLHDKIEPQHITNLIDKGKENVHHVLMSRFKDKLEPHHITDLIHKGNDNITSNIISRHQDKLNSDHISDIISKKDNNISRELMYHMPNKLESKHISALINKGDDKTHAELMSRMHDKLEPEHISRLISKGDDNTKKVLLSTLTNKIEPKHIKELFDSNTPIHHINNAYSKMSEESKKTLVEHAKALKDNGDDRWADLTNTHEHMDLNKIDNARRHIKEAMQGPIGQLHLDLTDDEIKTHIHPIINKHIEAAEGNAKKSGRALVTFASMINKDQTAKLLGSIKGIDANLPDVYGTRYPTHVRDAIIDHSIKTDSPKLLTHALDNSIYGSPIADRHIEHIKTNHPDYMPLVDTKGTHAKEVADAAIKHNDTETLEKLADSNNPKYRSAVLKHTVNSDNTSAIISHLHAGTVPHDDLDKILFREHEKGYKGKKSNDIIQAVSTQPNLHSRHIDHIIKSGNANAIKNMIGGGYDIPRQNLSSKHVDRIVALKDKDISRHLVRYHGGLNPVQQFNNTKVINEAFLTNTIFERLLKESLISSKTKPLV